MNFLEKLALGLTITSTFVGGCQPVIDPGNIAAHTSEGSLLLVEGTNYSSFQQDYNGIKTYFIGNPDVVVGFVLGDDGVLRFVANGDFTSLDIPADLPNDKG